MAQISDLVVATAVSDTDEFFVRQGGEDKRVSKDNLVAGVSHDKLNNLQSGRGHAGIHPRVTNVEEVSTGIFNDGDKVILSDRRNVRVNIVAAGGADGYGIINAGVGKVGIIQVDYWLDVVTFGADPTQTIDSLAALNAAKDYGIANRKVLTASKNDFFKISDQLNLTSVAAKFNFATIKADFSGKPAVILGNDADISDLDLSPTAAYANNAGIGAAAPVDHVSHGVRVTGRPILHNIASRDFRGYAWDFSPANSNAAELWNLWGTGSHRGFNMADNATDNLSIMTGSLYAFGNSNAGFFSNTGSNFRQNKLFIRSEFNNLNGQATFGGKIIDCFIGGANRNQLDVYSEGTGGIAEWNIWVDEGSSDFYNTINSLRQDKDHITHSNVTRSGSRHYQNDANGSAAILEIATGNSNVNTLPMRVDFRRGAGRYGQILGKDAALWLSHSNDEQLLGCANGYAVVGNTHVIAAKVTLTTATPTVQIKIGDLASNKLMAGNIFCRGISGGFAGRRQFTQSFNAFNGTVTNGTASPNNINSGSDAFSTFTVTQVGTEVFLNLTYDSGNLGATYGVKYQVEWSIV
jgi:hypothetical protein